MSPKNIAASVRARLSNHARKSSRPFQEVLQYYAMERFLYRLSQSEYRDRFILKGALMLRVWDAPISRPTRDIDLLGRTDNSVESIVATIRNLYQLSVPPDGLEIDMESITGQRIKEDAEYEGVRVLFNAYLENARIRMQIDIGFGDVVTPAPSEIEYPSILDFPAPVLQMYPRETVVAEKFQAMVYLGSLNSRMKDFYDLWLLCRQFDFNGPILARAIEATFERRDTGVDSHPLALTPEFTRSEVTMARWQAFIRKGGFEGVPVNLEEITERLTSFLSPIAAACAEGQHFDMRWTAPGPWTR